MHVNIGSAILSNQAAKGAQPKTIQKTHHHFSLLQASLHPKLAVMASRFRAENPKENTLWSWNVTPKVYDLCIEAYISLETIMQLDGVMENIVLDGSKST